VPARGSATIPGGQAGKVAWTLTAARRKALRKRRSVPGTLAGTSRNRAGDALSMSGRRALAKATAKRKQKRKRG
jgi:hypothetical protein